VLPHRLTPAFAIFTFDGRGRLVLFQILVKYGGFFYYFRYNIKVKDSNIKRGIIMNSVFGDDLKKIFLAGLGAVAVTSEKSKQIVDDLVKKGELTLDQGKTLNEELKHNIKDKVKEHVTVTVNQPADIESIKKAVGNLSGKELEELKTEISRVENSGADGKSESEG